MLRTRWEGGRSWPVLVAALPPGWRAVSSALVGGGIGPAGWWVDAMVAREYFHPDPVAHVREIAAGLGLAGPGVGMLTAADVTRYRSAAEAGVVAVATVGLGLPVWAAAPDDVIAREADVRVGTINVLVTVPVALSDAALVNAVVTATEAKTQALVEAGVPGSGTSSDAVAVACPAPVPGEPVEEYGGPRSDHGRLVARTVHRAVSDGTDDWLRGAGRWPRAAQR